MRAVERRWEVGYIIQGNKLGFKKFRIFFVDPVTKSAWVNPIDGNGLVNKSIGFPVEEKEKKAFVII